MASVTIQLTEQEIRALQARTGETTPEAALKAWAAYADPQYTTTQLRSALKESLKEETSGKGKHFDSGREAMGWLES